MPASLSPDALAHLRSAADTPQALQAALEDAGAVSAFIEEAAEYWATDDAFVVTSAEQDGGMLKASGTVAFTDTPWEACGAAVHAQRKTIPVAIEVDLETGAVAMHAA